MGKDSSNLSSSFTAAYGLDKLFPSMFTPGAPALRKIPANTLFEYLTDAYQRTFFFSIFSAKGVICDQMGQLTMRCTFQNVASIVTREAFYCYFGRYNKN